MSSDQPLSPGEEEAARREIVALSQRIHARGWVANHDGNLSCRLGPGRILCTPTAVSKGDVALESLIVVDGSGAKVEGTRRPFSELTLHLAAYGERPDVGAVIHAHPPFATAFACAGISLDPPFMPEAVVSLGASIPTCDFALPFGAEGAAPLKAHLERCDAFLLASHGVVAIGPDLETAYLRLELVEHLARIKHLAMALGGPRPLSEDALATLLAKRTQAGLGPEARGIPPKEAPPVSAGVGPCSGAPLVSRGGADAATQAEIERLVADEIARILGQS